MKAIGRCRYGYGSVAYDADTEKRDEQFMRDLVVRLKSKEKSNVPFPWQCESLYCSRYHEHDEWAPRMGVSRCR